MTLRELLGLLPDPLQNSIHTSIDGLLEGFAGDPDAMFHAPFISVEYVAHIPETVVREFQTKDALKAHVESSAGLSNAFTSAVFCFEVPRYLPYQAWCLDKDGVQRPFVKAEEDDRSDEELFADLPGFYISWC